MNQHYRSAGVIRVALLAASCIIATTLSAQGIKDQLPPEIRVQRAAGDSVQPVFDGWQRMPNGNIAFWFGYMNRNYQEQVDVPLGPNNNLDPGGDKGQPTHFYTRRHQYVFKVEVPGDFDKDKKIIWSVTAHGETCTAIGWLQAEWEVDDGVRQMNAGAGLAPPYDPPNRAPSITGGSSKETAEVGKPVKLTASATDDGVPKPRGPRGGVSIRWIMYRGPGQVEFEPDTSTPVYGKPVEGATQATFSAPGTYWLQAIASDGLLEATRDVTVTVTGGSSTASKR